MDEHNEPILQIVYKRADTIEISGLFELGTHWVAATPHSFMPREGLTTFDPQILTKSYHIKTLFKYPSRLHDGQLAD